MTFPIQIATKHFPLTEAEDQVIREAAAGLERVAGRIERCRVMVDLPHRRWRMGARYGIRIDVLLPGEGLVVARQEHPSFRTAVQEGFTACRRRLQDVAERRIGQRAASISLPSPPPPECSPRDP